MLKWVGERKNEGKRDFVLFKIRQDKTSLIPCWENFVVTNGKN